jgi:Domain of unknown function (DUF5047)
VRPVSAAFLRTIRGSHKMFARATILETFQTGTQPTGTTVSIIDGSVTSDANADVRSRLTLMIDGNGLFPRDPNGLIAPYGNEVFVERGIEYGNGTTEIVSLGYFRIYTIEQETAPNGPIIITALDRNSGFIDGRFETPLSVGPPYDLDTVFNLAIRPIYPTVTIDYDFNPAAIDLEAEYVGDEDRFGFIKDICTAYGKIMYWDYRGHLVISDPPDPTVVVYDVNYGQGGVLVQLARHLDREGVYNSVVATGEQADPSIPPVTAIARDGNPLSPTYVNGKFGLVPRYYSSPFITNQTQAQSAADKILQQSMGLPYSIDFTTVPNPALEVLDPIRVTYSSDTTAEVHVIQSLTIPLTSREPMTGTTKEQTETIVEVG